MLNKIIKMEILMVFSVMITLTSYARSQRLVTEDLNNNVTITANPPFIIEGKTYQVDIECTFKRDTVPSMASVMSMVIAHSNKTDLPVFNYLALVNAMDGHAHNVSQDVDVISGSINNNGESKLHMRFMYPETHLIGLYMCEVTGFDQIGKPVLIYSTVNVVSTNITDLVGALHNAQSNITDLVDALHNAQSNITDLVDALRNSQSNLSAMRVCQSTYIETMHKLHSTFCTNYYPPLFYNGHVYYLSHTSNYFNRTEIQSKCEVLGGYLIELDSHNEFHFIRDYLIKLGNVRMVWTGATDEKQEGDWINEHNSTSRPSFDWAAGYPVADRTTSCQCFDLSVNLFLLDFSCYVHGFQNQYICEMPENIC